MPWKEPVTQKACAYSARSRAVATSQFGGMLVFHMPAQKLTPDIIQAAIEGFEAQKRRIDAQVIELRQMLDGGRPEMAVPSAPHKRKRRLSAAGRKAIAEAARKRWAAIRANSAQPQSPSSKTPSRKRSLAK